MASLTSIICLLFRGCPPAIFRRVGTVVVDTVNRHSWWRFAHVGKEVLERTSPSFADRNPTTTPTWIILVTRGCASLFHAAPNPISARVALTMNNSGLTEDLFRQTTATLGAFEIRSEHGFFRATLACDFPEGSVGFGMGKTNNSQCAETKTSNILNFAATRLKVEVGHLAAVYH
ncbi:MAG: hypothetical protein UY28_C0004G0040 [Candidatus Amesbacteria bacterium GW2011_GWB1_48_13]|uniref:Uncharacterized protein n=1 Tax=Candidatus Amesbacteria bacterium GW2011_GWB1_48_13 TaxID=1618362 RepID=A0A0G1UVX7_9BACT|nr:MAG: hypothetical protein UY28_C0004G0040 [Candidatus Amesbacteria bacterium GW2011_GWB1_48_13]